MRLALSLIASVLVHATFACGKNLDSITDAERVERRPVSPVGDALDFDIRIKCVRMVMGDGAADAGFEIQNQGRSIIEARGSETAEGTRLTLAVEVFTDGKWERRSADAASGATAFVELWPGAKVYGQAQIPNDAEWGRILVVARGMVRKADRVTVAEPIEVTSDAFEIAALR